MAKMLLKKFSSPDETRQFKAHGHAEILKIGGGTIGRGVFEPGWRWTADVGPIAGTRSCETEHACYCVSGRMHLRMDDGQEAEMGPGDYCVIPAGHDAWVVGDETCVLVDFAGMENYAKPRAQDAQARPEAQPGMGMH